MILAITQIRGNRRSEVPDLSVEKKKEKKKTDVKDLFVTIEERSVVVVTRF